jgi:hypothetical protein
MDIDDVTALGIKPQAQQRLHHRDDRGGLMLNQDRRSSAQWLPVADALRDQGVEQGEAQRDACAPGHLRVVAHRTTLHLAPAENQ